MPNIFSSDRKEAIRSRLLREGRQMMLEKGISGMNLEKLALSAGIAKGTFYNFFRTKQHFILAIIRDYQLECYKALEAEAAKRAGTLSLQEALQMVMDLYAPELNPMFRMSDRDLDYIAEKIPPEELFDREMDLKSCGRILSCVKGLRPDTDLRVVSNFSRMVMFTLMQQDYIYKEVLQENIRMIVSMLSDYIADPCSGAEDKEK